MRRQGPGQGRRLVGSREGHHPPRAEALHRPLPAALGIAGPTLPVQSPQGHSRVIDNLQPLPFLEGQVSLCP